MAIAYKIMLALVLILVAVCGIGALFLWVLSKIGGHE